MTTAGELVVTIDDVRDASRRLEGEAVRTPLVENAVLNEIAGRRVFIKPETLQHAGSFKFRGAYNRLVQLSDTERKAGVVAWSSGNHAQGVAAAAKRLGIKATIVMPEDAPAIKVGNTRRLGAAIRFYDRYNESREEIGRTMAQEQGATLVPSYDDPHIIAGQGTVGLEIIEQTAELGVVPETVLICCGGGGLCAGSSLAIKAAEPGVSVYSVEPLDFDDTARSLATGQQEHVSKGAKSICDALLAPFPGDLTFPLNRTHLSGGLAVSDEDVKKAIRFAWESLKLVVEPGGAVALAALLSGFVEAGSGGPLVIVLSGGNIDAALMAECIGA